jgi:hypothetical protein
MQLFWVEASGEVTKPTTVKDEDIGPVRAVVGYRSDLLPQGMFSKIHLFTVAAATPEANVVRSPGLHPARRRNRAVFPPT